MKRLLHSLTTVTLIAVLALGSAPLLVNDSAEAAFVSNRSITLGSSNPSVTTTHNFAFTLVSGADPLGSIVLEYCSNNPFIGDPCTIPTGLNVSTAFLDSQTGETGFSVHANTNANTIVLTRAAAVPTPGPVTYNFSNILNGDQVNTTQFVRISTHQTVDGSGIHSDEGGLAYALEDAFSISAYNPPYLEFCVGITITGNDCSTATGTIVNLGSFNENTTRTGTSQMTGATNDGNGYIITVSGPTMTSGNNTINPMLTRGPSNQGVSQFGINLRNNSSPNVGTNVTGPGVAVPTANYGALNQYKFTNGDAIAASAIESHYRTFTVSYIVNVAPDESPGQYATTLTYIATATF